MSAQAHEKTLHINTFFPLSFVCTKTNLQLIYTAQNLRKGGGQADWFTWLRGVNEEV